MQLPRAAFQGITKLNTLLGPMRVRRFAATSIITILTSNHLFGALGFQTLDGAFLGTRRAVTGNSGYCSSQEAFNRQRYQETRRAMVSAFSNDGATMTEDDEFNALLPYEDSAHGSATICIPGEEDPNFSYSSFRSRLEATCDAMRELKKSSIWIEVPMSRARFIEETVDLGFEFHHAEGKSAKLNLWLREDTESKVPEYATHHIGVGAIVVNSKDEILCVRELRKNYMPWKIPGGLSELGESIADAAEREVMEETGIPASFHSVLGFRHTHGLAHGRSDMYFVCRLDPIEETDENGNAIVPEPCAQACEIEATKWVPLDEYRAMVNGNDGGSGHPMMRNIMKIYDDGMKIKQKEVSSVVPGRKANPLYLPDAPAK